MNRLYQEFLGYGYMPEQFFRLSVNEAIDVINSQRKRKEQREKDEFRTRLSTLDIFGSNLIEKVLHVLGMSEDGEISMLKHFPELFPELLDVADEQESESKPEKVLSKEMQLYKAQRIQHAYHVNVRNKQKTEATNGR